MSPTKAQRDAMTPVQLKRYRAARYAQFRRWYAKNKKKYAAIQRAYYAKNKAMILMRLKVKRMERALG